MVILSKVVSDVGRRTRAGLTHLVTDDGIEHDSLAELVRLAAAGDGDSPLLRHHRDHCRSCSTEHAPVREEGVSAQ